MGNFEEKSQNLISEIQLHLLVMAKIRIHSGRGTGTIEIDKSATNWAGSEFKKVQEARKKAAQDKYVTVGRGTGKIKFGDIPTTKSKSTKGLWVSTGRGTGRRRIQ